MSGEERASRPNSLVLEAPAPEREPLRFDVQLVGAPPEVEQLVNNIKQVAEDFLYHWKTFPIVLPQSRFSGPGNRPSDIIVPPPCDELDAAALDAGVEPHPLSPKQLHSIREKGLLKDRYRPKKLNIKQLDTIRERGEFEVPSRHFPGQIHVWRVAGWLQRGRVRAREELYCHIARAIALVVVVSRDRLLRDEPLSLIAGAKALMQGLHRLIDLIFGMPSLEARDLDKKIREERSRYLVAELICKPENQEDIAALAAWVNLAMRRANSESRDIRDNSRAVPRIPYLYTTPQRTQEVSAAAMREYVSRVCGAVLACEQLAALGPALPDLLAAQLRAAVIVNRAEEGVRRKLEAGLSTAEARIRASHPIISRADAWRKEKLAAAAHSLRNELRWAGMEDAANAMQGHKLPQHRYFLLRDLTFLRDREPLLMKELRAAKTPTREFIWSTRIWLPQNWEIHRHFRGRSERIPTVISTRATNIVTPRSDPSQPVFLASVEKTRATTTRWPGWRLLNLAHRTWCWAWNLMFLLGVLVPWCSPLSLRTLLCVKPFVPDLELSQVNGTLFPKRSSETQTMWSMLLKLWRHISKERTRFETEPDTGLLGKGLSRQANRLWNYGLIGGLGSVLLLLVFPLVTLAASVLSLLAAVSVPLWMLPVTLVMHAGFAVVYDLDCPNPGRVNRWFALFEALIWRVGLLGLVQPVLAFVVAIFLCPLASIILLVGGVSWWLVRGAWEALAWRALIVRAARVPAHDSRYCHRVAGPALHSYACYQISAAQALAAVCARGELEALAAWAADTEAAIERPLRDYRHFVDACFGPFSVQIAKTGAYKQIEKECGELVWSAREKLAARRRDLALPLTDAARARVRMLPNDLRKAVHASAAELSRMWGAAARADEWWAARGLEPADWHALAANTLVEVFDAEILVALEEGEARVALESGAGAARWHELAARHPAPPDVLAERDDWRPAPDGVERYRGGGSEATSETSGSETPEDEAAREPALCRISPRTERAACRWTLTGRGVRLRADLASPEDVTLDADRHVGTDV
uniref:Similar to CG2519 n=1 Tax=Heliconius melpomene TaxID=34740 RepID=C9S269_HELME|nr:similar to CG2519 [Heliconius melpomene]